LKKIEEDRRALTTPPARRRTLCCLGREQDQTDTLTKAETHWRRAREQARKELLKARGERRQVSRKSTQRPWIALGPQAGELGFEPSSEVLRICLGGIANALLSLRIRRSHTAIALNQNWARIGNTIPCYSPAATGLGDRRESDFASGTLAIDRTLNKGNSSARNHPAVDKAVLYPWTQWGL
jgi:hypothetical protein